MARRRARSPVAAGTTDPGEMNLSARVAWAYLTALIAGVVATVLVLLANQAVVPLLCRVGDGEALADCRLGWAIWIALIGFLLAAVPMAIKARLGWWWIVVLWAGTGLWVAVDALDRWWWWVAALLLPAAAAGLSTPWPGGRQVRSVQRIVIGLILVAAIGSLVWWWNRG